MKPLYRVRNWGTTFENSRSRAFKKLDWVPIPNKHDGKSYRRLVGMANGIAVYGTWQLIVQVASKCHQRGVLADEDGPLDATDLSFKTGVSADLFEQAFEVLTSPAIGWMSVDPSGNCQGADSAPTDAVSALSLNRTERTEGNGKKEESSAAVAADHESKRKPKTGRAPFVVPTIDEVTAYCRERGNSVDPQRFVDHYTSNGWRVGKNPMRDWHASIRTWEKNEHAAPSSGTQPRNRSEQRLSGSLGAIANVVQSGGLRPGNGDPRRLEAHD